MGPEVEENFIVTPEYPWILWMVFTLKDLAVLAFEPFSVH